MWSGITIGPSETGSSSLTVTASSNPKRLSPTPPGAGSYASRSSLSIGVNSQPGIPRNAGISMSARTVAACSRRSVSVVLINSKFFEVPGAAGDLAPTAPNLSGAPIGSADAAFHLELDEAVHLDRVLHRELLDDRLDEAVDDELARLVLGDAVGHEVEELLLADLRDGRLVADVDVVLADPDRRVGVRARLLVKEQRVADDLGLRALGALRDLEQAAVARAPAVLGDRLREDVRGRARGRVDDLA